VQSLGVPGLALVEDLASCHRAIRELLSQPGPMFLGRIGGSDSDIVIAYHDLRSRLGEAEALRAILPKFGIVKLFNGYYDKDHDDRKVARFCQLMADAYFACSDLLVVGEPLLTEFMPGTINSQFHVDTSAIRGALRSFIAAISSRHAQTRLFPYGYVEQIVSGQDTLFRLFAELLPGKRVLVVSPFAESIRTNFGRRHEFFPNYTYPNFALSTYNTPITYHGLPPEFYPDHDWFATVERMKAELSRKDFDIALLSCGSYAMPLGLHVRDVMQRKAIYVGGCLQLFFGITGRRYDNPFFLNQINSGAFILPLERERFLRHVPVEPGSARDAFGAYF
jgi:hypothetical protein